MVPSDIKPENILFNPIPIAPSKAPKKLQPSHPDDAPKVDEGEFQPGVGGGGIGEIKLADFGLSKVIWDASTMTPCGTVGYTAPEIIRDQKYSKAVDMWAMGCVLYTLLCGFPPFYDESIKLLTEKVAKGQYSFLSPWWDTISDSSKDLIRHLLCIDPDERYTIDEFLRHPWVQEGQQPTPQPENDETAPRPGVANDTLQPPTDAATRKDLLSPGVTMKQAFDVTYAVQRMGEDKKRKKALYERIGNMKFDDNQMEEDNSLDAVDQDTISESADDDSSSEESEEDDIDQLLPATLNSAALSNAGGSALGDELTKRLQAAQQKRIAKRMAEQQKRRDAAGQQKVSAATPNSAYNARKSRRAPFELNMNNATLLAKRNIAPTEA
jgi:serine/threonine protein kinase